MVQPFLISTFTVSPFHLLSGVVQLFHGYEKVNDASPRYSTVHFSTSLDYLAKGLRARKIRNAETRTVTDSKNQQDPSKYSYVRKTSKDCQYCLRRWRIISFECEAGDLKMSAINNNPSQDHDI